MLRLRLVIDTDVLVSAALKPEGLQRTAFLLATTKPARLHCFPGTSHTLFSREHALGFSESRCITL